MEEVDTQVAKVSEGYHRHEQKSIAKLYIAFVCAGASVAITTATHCLSSSPQDYTCSDGTVAAIDNMMAGILDNCAAENGFRCQTQIGQDILDQYCKTGTGGKTTCPIFFLSFMLRLLQPKCGGESLNAVQVTYSCEPPPTTPEPTTSPTTSPTATSATSATTPTISPAALRSTSTSRLPTERPRTPQISKLSVTPKRSTTSTTTTHATQSTTSRTSSSTTTTTTQTSQPTKIPNSSTVAISTSQPNKKNKLTAITTTTRHSTPTQSSKVHKPSTATTTATQTPQPNKTSRPSTTTSIMTQEYQSSITSELTTKVPQYFSTTQAETSITV